MLLEHSLLDLCQQPPRRCVKLGHPLSRHQLDSRRLAVFPPAKCFALPSLFERHWKVGPAGHLLVHYPNQAMYLSGRLVREELQKQLVSMDSAPTVARNDEPFSRPGQRSLGCAWQRRNSGRQWRRLCATPGARYINRGLSRWSLRRWSEMGH